MAAEAEVSEGCVVAFGAVEGDYCRYGAAEWHAWREGDSAEAAGHRAALALLLLCRRRTPLRFRYATLDWTLWASWVDSLDELWLMPRTLQARLEHAPSYHRQANPAS